MKSKIFVIAEAGVNHNGSLPRAMRLIEAAKSAGADAVKFQSFVTERLVTKTAPKAEYQKKTDKKSRTQWEMLKRLELNRAAHEKLFRHAKKCGIEFLSTPFDGDSLKMLVSLGMKKIKIASGELTNARLLLEASVTNRPVILSTGMADMTEVQSALGVLAFGYSRRSTKNASMVQFRKAFRSEEGKRLLRQKVTLLHCLSVYPAPLEHLHLRSMNTLEKACGLSVGLSDHSRGCTAAVAAAARGAVVIEKHLTLDKNLPGPDHAASLEPQEFKQMVRMLREVERLLGSSKKSPAPAELPIRAVARRSLVAASSISKGQRFSSQNLTAKRPANGMSPMLYWDLLGKQSRHDYRPDERVKR